MKKTILFLSVLLSCSQAAFAYDFSAVAPSGQTLYYNINGGEVIVTHPNNSDNTPWQNYSNPVGDLIIPDTVTYSGTTYSVTSIGLAAFCQCSGLTSVIIPNSVTSIGNSAFSHCSGLTSVIIPNSVTNIGYSAFCLCTGLTSVTIGNSVTNIGNDTFFGCSGLTSITIPNSVTNIGNWAFSYCDSLTSVTIGDSVINIGENAFCCCCSLTSITIPNSVTNIGYSAFYGCTSLTSITIGDSVTRIGVDAFYGCTSLTSVIIPSSVTYIGGNAFYGCTGLTSVTISARSIGPYAFNSCSNLTSVTIGGSVSRIDNAAFSYSTSLTSITFLRQSPPTMGSFSTVFNGMPSNYMVYIPCGSLSQYSNKIPSSHLQQMYYDFSAVSADDSTGTVDILTEPTCANHNAVISAVPADGYLFNHWSTGSTDNPYTLTVTSDTTITAFFVEAYIVTVLVDNPATGSITGGGVYGEGSSVTITAYPADGYLFDHWSTGSTDNPYTLTVISDTTITVFFEDANIVTVLVDNPAMGSVTGGGAYENGSSVTITAYPADGYLFDHWSTGNTDNPYTLTVTTDTTITAYFVPNGGTEGIGEIDEDDIRIDVLDGCIFVEGITNEELRVYDITGRIVQNHSLPSGVYIVKIGQLPARKVVVIK